MEIPYSEDGEPRTYRLTSEAVDGPSLETFHGQVGWGLRQLDLVLDFVGDNSTHSGGLERDDH